jgi:type IV secretion system protein VirB4
MLTIVLATLFCFALLYLGLRRQSLGVVREFRTKLKGYSDTLVYAALVEDGVVLNKDGALMAGFEYRGNDLDSASDVELDVLSERVNAALCRRGSGWMVHVDAIRFPVAQYSELGAFPDRTTALIDRERRLQSEAEGVHFNTRYILVLTYLPPSDREDRFTDFLVEGDKVRDDTATTRTLRAFNAALQEIEDNLSSSLRLRRLRSKTETDAAGRTYIVDEMLSHLSTCVSANDHPVRRPALPMFLDAVLGGVDFFGGLKPRVGDKHIRAIAITGFPSESYPGILEALNRLAMPYRWSNRFIFLDPADARKRLETYHKKWFVGRQSVRSLIASQTGSETSGTVNNEALRMAADAQGAVDDLASDAVRFGFYTSVIVVADADPGVADERAREVLKLLFNLGFNGRIEEVNAVEAFLGTHPGNGYANVRKPLVHTKNVADFLPLTAVWAGEAAHPCPFYPKNSAPLAYAGTSGATPFRLNLHVGDLGHTLILGPSGAGKSTLLAFLAASQFRYANAQVFVFDKGYSAYPLVRAAGGRHYDIMGELSNLCFCPLQHVDGEAERAWANGWLESLVELQGIRVTPNHRRAIHHALELLGESESRTMTDLLSGPLQEPELRAALGRYTLEGPLGSLLDSRVDVLRDDPFQVFELEHLMAAGGGAKTIAPVLLYLFHRIEQRLDGRPTLIILDEAWTLIDNPLFAEQIRDWLKTLRKKNAAVVFATQSVSDILDKPITSAILESCPTKIFLPNAEARTEASQSAYKRIGLSERQTQILASAVPKRHYYYTSPLGQRLFELGLGPVALSFLGAGGKEDLATVSMLADTYGAFDWPAEWLWQRNLKVAAANWVDPQNPQRAYDLMARYRDTWPAELMRADGRELDAQRWLAARGAQSDGDVPQVAFANALAGSAR